MLGAATGISWGFMAAVTKELSSHLGGGPGAVFSSWSPYVLIAAGAATMLLASHALAAGPLAASQPGFTIFDPLAASLLGMFLFGEHIRTGAWDLAGQALALAVVIAGAAALSRSLGEDGHPSREHQPALSGAASSPSAARPLAHPDDLPGTGSCAVRHAGGHGEQRRGCMAARAGRGQLIIMAEIPATRYPRRRMPISPARCMARSRHGGDPRLDLPSGGDAGATVDRRVHGPAGHVPPGDRLR